MDIVTSEVGWILLLLGVSIVTSEAEVDIITSEADDGYCYIGGRSVYYYFGDCEWISLIQRLGWILLLGG